MTPLPCKLEDVAHGFVHISYNMLPLVRLKARGAETKNENETFLMNLPKTVSKSSLSVDADEKDDEVIRTCRNFTRNCRNLTRNCRNLTRNCRNLTRNCHNLTRNCHNLTRTCHNLTRNCHNLTRNCLNVTGIVKGILCQQSFSRRTDC